MAACKNVPAQLIDEALLVYQVAANMEIDSLTPYDAGVAIPPETNHLTYSDMIAAPCPPGKYRLLPSGRHVPPTDSPDWSGYCGRYRGADSDDRDRSSIRS